MTRLATLTRYPGTKLSPATWTGDPIIDDYMADLDRRLLGSARVRLQTLTEIRDHIEERRACSASSDNAGHEAVAAAVASLGPAAEIAGEQRSALRQKFVRLGLPAGVMFGLFMAVYWLVLMDSPLGLVTGLALAQGVFFGIVFGWTMTFVLPERTLPSAARDAAIGNGSEFVVAYGPWMRRLSLAMFVLFVGFGVFSTTLGLGAALGWRLPEHQPWPWWGSVSMGALSLRYGEFRRERGKPVRVLVYPDMHRADQLYTRLCEHARAEEA